MKIKDRERLFYHADSSDQNIDLFAKQLIQKNDFTGYIHWITKVLKSDSQLMSDMHSRFLIKFHY